MCALESWGSIKLSKGIFFVEVSRFENRVQLRNESYGSYGSY